jgi:hypothetical protein
VNKYNGALFASPSAPLISENEARKHIALPTKAANLKFETTEILTVVFLYTGPQPAESVLLPALNSLVNLSKYLGKQKRCSSRFKAIYN